MMIEFPAAVVSAGTLVMVVGRPIPFTTPDGVGHSAHAWTAWTAEDWTEKAQGWTILPVVDEPPALAPGERAIRQPEAAWLVEADAVRVAYAVEAIPLDQRRGAVVAAINAERARRLAVGAPYAGRHIDVSDKGRADLAGMTLAAILAASDPTAWTSGYATGWITMDNTRLALPEPADGLALARAVGAWYGAVMQHARDLKDAALVSGEPEGVDVLAGWPAEGA